MVFHSKMVLAFRYGDDDERRCWWWDWRFWKPFPQQNEFGVQLTKTISTAKWFWHSGTVMMMNNGVDGEIEDSSGDDDERRWWFSLFARLVRFVLFGFLWGCRKQLCWDLCTVYNDFLMHHNRSWSPVHNKLMWFKYQPVLQFTNSQLNTLGWDNKA